MKVFSGILFQNMEVSSISKICSGKQFSSTVSLSEFPKILTTVVYAVRRYATHDCTWRDSGWERAVRLSISVFPTD